MSYIAQLSTIKYWVLFSFILPPIWYPFEFFFSLFTNYFISLTGFGYSFLISYLLPRNLQFLSCALHNFLFLLLFSISILTTLFPLPLPLSLFVLVFLSSSSEDIMGFNPLVLDTLNTIQVAANLGPGSFGAYVISQATSASDVLAVMLLQVCWFYTYWIGIKANIIGMMAVIALLLWTKCAIVESLLMCNRIPQNTHQQTTPCII